MFLKSKWLIIQSIITSLFLRYYFDSQIYCFLQNRLTNITYLSNSYQNSAFSCLSIKINSISKKRKKNISSEIIINGLNNYSLKKKLFYLFNVLLYNHQFFEKEKLIISINKLKLSGFFKSVSFSIYYIGNHQVIILDVVPNSIVRKVYILNYQNKLIPISSILFLFRLQLGYPKNLVEISHAINKITQWYYAKGYQHVKITLYKFNLNDNVITLKICEGKISKVEVLNVSKINKVNKKFTILAINFIIKKLRIEPNQILNIRNLNNNISKLKIKRILLRCNYKIAAHNREETKFSIRLEIEMSDEKFIFFTMKNIFGSHCLLESFELFIQYSLDYFLFNYVQSSTLLMTNQSRTLYMNMANCDIFPYKIFNLSISNLSKEICEWYFIPILFILGNYWGLKYSIQNIGYSFKNCIVHVQCPPTGLHFNLKYEDFWLRILNHASSSLNIQIFKKNYIYAKHGLPILLDQINTKFYSDQNTFFTKKGIEIDLNHELNENLTLIEKVTWQEILKKCFVLYNFLFWDYLIDPIILSYIHNIYSQFKLISLDQKQTFLNFSFNCVYLNVSNKNFLSFKEKFTIELILFITEKLQIPNQCFKTILTYSSYIKCKIVQNYKINLTPFTTVQKQILHYSFELMSSLASHYYFPFSEILFLLGPDRVRGYKETLYYLPNAKFIILNLEYHFCLRNQNTIFLFVDCLFDIKNVKNNSNIVTLYGLSNLNQHLGYGIGVQIQAPIRQIPPIRIEYGFKLNASNYFHLRINHY
uniref:Polypeptide-transport-associated ShlB-type domain-containing protein n=1 Tax=Kumanoa americana TaxID=1196377 RepID=A0A1C9CGG9_9FLOR|nr:hypothetical protein Kuma_056 [Kumanoa americana]AOM67490.1 hypothetical protein Kuma_056 [Kumanoa americana]